MKTTYFIRWAAGLGALAVALGAFGAHGLRELVDAADLETYRTGVRYHFYHTLGVAAGAVLLGDPRFTERTLVRACWCWITGILLFSGSLYLLTLADLYGLPKAVLGPITPLGGVFFIAGWVLLGLASRRGNPG